MTADHLVNRGWAVWFAGVMVVVLALAGVPVARGASRPPAPAGLPRVSPGQLPKPCAAGDQKFGFDGNGSVLGVYYDARVKRWVNGPYCYPVWGFLTASGSRIVDPGEAVTIAAMPNAGSNSASYAPITHAVSWTTAGRRKGCGTDDLTCTVVATRRATGSWQWFQVEVSMPRTFFLNSPGSLCTNIPICPGATTHAWSWIGVRPKASPRVELSGEVVRRERSDPEFRAPAVRPVRGARVTAKRGKRQFNATTAKDGTYSLSVPRGAYALRISRVTGSTEPKSRSVTANRDTDGLDFTVCRPNPADDAELKAKGCRLVRIEGTVHDRDGALFAPGSPNDSSSFISVVSFSADGSADGRQEDLAYVDALGRFTVWTTPGAGRLRVGAVGIGNEVATSFPVKTVGSVTKVTLKVPPIVVPFHLLDNFLGDIGGVDVALGFIPAAGLGPYYGVLERSEPVLDQYCQYKLSLTTTAFGQYASWSFMPESPYLRICEGPYTVTAYDAKGRNDGFPLATKNFTLGRQTR